MDTLSRSAIAARPKPVFLDWLHNADPTRDEITLFDVCREPAIYLIPECDTDAELAHILGELYEEIFEEQRAAATKILRSGLKIGATTNFAGGSTVRITPC